MQDTGTIVERYFAVWNEPDAGKRRALITTTWSEDADYRDPRLAGDGHDGIDAMVAMVHEYYPGYRFEQVGPIDSHNDRLRFAWRLNGPDGGPPAFSGTDFGVLGEDGRLRSITGFFDPAPDA
ncbi:MAG TPA: nuclear transport factor 2 family protein [Thermomicrobiales bacterium]|nr:nuclear transport factor 2 family protein [Thermomicrobiales bacterium]